jgi:hypothetical protein
MISITFSDGSVADVELNAIVGLIKTQTGLPDQNVWKFELEITGLGKRQVDFSSLPKEVKWMLD